METSSNYAVLVLEQPWWALDEDPEQTSVRHFLDGLSRLTGLPTFYATFFDSSSFGQALQYLLDARKIDDVDHLIVYVASHGSGSRLGGTDNARAMNLKTVFDRIASHGKGKVIGLILDSCEVGAQADTIETGMSSAKISWVIAYAGCMDWLTTMLINLRAVSVLTGLESDIIKKKDDLMGAMQMVFDMFNPLLLIDEEASDDEEPDADDREKSLTLADALSVTIRPGHRKPQTLMPEEIWPALADDEEDE